MPNQVSLKLSRGGGGGECRVLLDYLEQYSMALKPWSGGDCCQASPAEQWLQAGQAGKAGWCTLNSKHEAALSNDLTSPSSGHLLNCLNPSPRHRVTVRGARSSGARARGTRGARAARAMRFSQEKASACWSKISLWLK